MSTEYRVIRTEDPYNDNFIYSIKEVYLDSTGKPYDLYEIDVSLAGTSFNALKTRLEKLTAALEKPVLEVVPKHMKEVE